jgi:glyoxylate reductase
MLGKVFIARPIFQDTVQTLKRETEVRVNPEDRVLSKAELMDNIKEVEGVITLVTDTIDRSVLDAAPRLKVVANFGVGVNNVDLQAATEMGVVVTNTPGVLTETTADLTWALLMAAARRIAEADRFVRSRSFQAWGPQMLLGHDVFGKTLGIIGLGRIGEAVARRARGFGMRILFQDPGRNEALVEELGIIPASLEDIYRQSDFISLHVPLVASSHHLLNDQAFALMKANCIVVNTSRGPVVDEKALVQALKTGKIAAAALDVFENEPQIEPELLDMDNVVMAPHVGSASYETRSKMSSMTADNLLAVLKGQLPPNLVNTDVWDRRRR